MTVIDIKKVLDSDSDDYIIKQYCGLYLIKYNKHSLTHDNVSTLGLFRSVITDGERILSFAPTKSQNYNHFIVNNDFQDCHISEFIDGTMINVFYNTSNINKNGKSSPKWEIATRSNIGANCRFNLNSNKTFREMFYDAICISNHTDSDFFDKLNKNYCYSFVLQHPENRIVHHVNTPQIYLTNVFDCCGNTISTIPNNEMKTLDMSEIVKYPKNIHEMFSKVKNWDYINLLCSGEQTSFNLQGFVITNSNNVRTKIRNIEYEKIKRIRGNSPKLQYQFLELYKQNKIKQYLGYFPEHIELFNGYRRDFYKWTETLYNLYINCFIEKTTYLRNCAFEFKPILYFLQKHYLLELRPNGKKVNFTYLKQYVKGIPTEKIMFSMNYCHRTLNENNENNENNKDTTVKELQEATI
mgnify:CR=1 FL=1